MRALFTVTDGPSSSVGVTEQVGGAAGPEPTDGKLHTGLGTGTDAGEVSPRAESLDSAAPSDSPATAGPGEEPVSPAGNVEEVDGGESITSSPGEDSPSTDDPVPKSEPGATQSPTPEPGVDSGSVDMSGGKSEITQSPTAEPVPVETDAIIVEENTDDDSDTDDGVDTSDTGDEDGLSPGAGGQVIPSSEPEPGHSSQSAGGQATSDPEPTPEVGGSRPTASGTAIDEKKQGKSTQVESGKMGPGSNGDKTDTGTGETGTSQGKMEPENVDQGSSTVDVAATRKCEGFGVRPVSLMVVMCFPCKALAFKHSNRQKNR